MTQQTQAYEREPYPDLLPGTPVEARINDVEIPVGAIGRVIQQMCETGNYQCLFELGDKRRVVALCPDQLTPTGQPIGNRILELQAQAHHPVLYQDTGERKKGAWSPEAHARQVAATKAYHERKRLEKTGEVIAEREDRNAPRTVRPVKVDSQPVAVPVTVADVPLSVVTSPIAMVGARTSPIDWIHEAVQLMRQVIADAAGDGSPAQMALLVEVTAYLEGNRQGAA